jgi:phosphate transport system protein
MSRINTELERIGDLAENIAERAIFLANEDKIEIPFNFTDMTEKTLLMLKKSINALIDMNIDLAYEVCLSDDEVDNINKQMYQQIEDAIRSDTNHLKSFIHLLGVSRNLERIADNATNIAEEVIYVISGNIVRHKIQRSLSTDKKSPSDTMTGRRGLCT